MLQNESEPLSVQHDKRVARALALVPDGEGEALLDEHVRWEFEAVLSRLQLDDFTTREVVAVLAIIAPIHSRVIRSLNGGQPPSGTLLHLVRT